MTLLLMLCGAAYWATSSAPSHVARGEGARPDAGFATTRVTADSESGTIVWSAPNAVTARTTFSAMRAYHEAHPDVEPVVPIFPEPPPPQAIDIEDRLTDEARAEREQRLRVTRTTAEAPERIDDTEALAPPLTVSFQGVIDNGNWIPPDTHGAVGPNHVVEILNSGFTVLGRDGSLIAAQITHQSYWSALGTAAGQPASRPFDPKIVYDQYTSRWVTTADANGPMRDGTNNSWVLVGISQSSDPTGAWNLFAIQGNANTAGFNHTNDWNDYPGLGVDPNNVTVTNNMFTVAASAFVHADVWVIDKASLIAAAGPLVLGTDYALFHNPGGIGGFTFQPTHSFGQTAGTAVTYLVDQGWTSTTDNTRRFIRMHDITGVGAGAALAETGWFEVAKYNFGQLDATQPNCSTPIETNDPRLLNAVTRNSKVWTTQSVGIGAVPAGAPPSRTEVAWYEFDPSSAAPFPGGVPNQQGRVSNASLYYYFPSIAVNRDECVALGFSGSDSSTFASGYYTARFPTDPPGTMQPVNLLAAGTHPYWKEFTGTRNRWGDYSATVVDPVDDETFWTVQEYATIPFDNANVCNADQGRWATWWGAFTCELEKEPKFSQPPVTCPCEGDVNKDEVVDIEDGQIVIDCIDGDCSGCINSCDINCDGVVDQRDADASSCLFFGSPPEVCCPAGEDVASNFDWTDMDPNVVVSDDFVSDGRPITGVRWWGSKMDKEYSPGIDVEPGVDLWRTVAGSTWQNFTGDPIPAGFFDPNSNEFTDTVFFQGVPLNTSPSLGATDTIVERLAPALLPQCGVSEATVPIEIVALSLRSVSPITVTYSDGSPDELWDVDVFLSDAGQTQGTMSIRQSCGAGGTYTSVLPVQAKLIFTRQSDLAVREFDTGLEGVPPIIFDASGSWVYQADPIFGPTTAPPGTEVDTNGDGLFDTVLPVGTSNFFPGFEENDCIDCKLTTPGQTKPPLTPEQAQWAAHGVNPPNQDDVQDGFCCVNFEKCFAEPDPAQCKQFGGFPVADCAECFGGAAAAPASGEIALSSGLLGKRLDDARSSSEAETGAALVLADFQLDDGTFEECIGVNDGTTGAPFGWANRFTNTTGGPITLGSIEVAFPPCTGVAVGDAVDAVIWVDAAATGDMVNATKVAHWSLPGGVHATDLSFATHTIPGGVSIPAGADFYVGLGDIQSQLDGVIRGPAALDQTTSAGRSWVFFGAATFDPDDLAGQTIGLIDDFDLPGNWLVRVNLCTSDFSVSAPGTFSGNTCGSGNDCGLRESEEHIYEVDIPNDGTWTFSTCGSNFDTWLFVGTSCCGGVLGSNDDTCGLQSEVTLNLTAGTYWVTIEAFGSTQCGDYVLDISKEPPVEKCVDPGDDCFHTACDGQTKYDFALSPVPAGFFCGTDSGFSGEVELGGPFVIPGDTIVRRLEPMCFDDTQLPQSETIPIELVSLNLVSCAPITVDCPPGDELWDVFVFLPAGPQPPGSMTVTKEDPDGGTFTASLPVDAEVCFGPAGFGGCTTGSLPAQSVVLDTTSPAPWLQNRPDLDSGCGSAGFAAGWKFNQDTGDPCCEDTCHANPGGGHEHCTQPAFCRKQGEKCPPKEPEPPPRVEPDGWFVSFHEPKSVGGSQQPPLALYFCDESVVQKTPTPLPACDLHPVTEYEVQLPDCCLIHANVDSRSGTVPASKAAFFEEQCFDYALDIQAVVGVRFVQDPITLECIEEKNDNTADGDFWGWHTTDFACDFNAVIPLQQALQTSIKMDLDDWLYGPWEPITPVCSQPNMAFELLTTTPPDPEHADNDGDCVPDKCEVPVCKLANAAVTDLIAGVVSKKNRFLTISTGGASSQNRGRNHAIRVIIESLPSPYDGLPEVELWVGVPTGTGSDVERLSSIAGTGLGGAIPGSDARFLRVAQLRCGPPSPGDPAYYRDWTDLHSCRGGDNNAEDCVTNADCPGGTCERDEFIHLYHPLIIPDGFYRAAVIDESCDPTLAGDFSARLDLDASRFGDVAGGTNCSPPAEHTWCAADDIVVVGDVVAAIDTFGNKPIGPIKPRAEAAGLGVSPVDGIIGVSDLVIWVDAVLGKPMTATPMAPPIAQPCP